MKNKISKLRLAAIVSAASFCGFAAAPAAQAAATIAIVNGDPAGVGFNDATVVAPVGGNVGTTLGLQRLIAFQAAANKWGATLTSSVTIRVLATFEPLSCSATSAVLGSAGATEIFRDFPGAPIAGSWYPKALTDKLVGFDADPATADIRARFNVNLGNPGCLTGLPFYLGLDSNHGALIDLVTVLTHEFGHGLGFQTFTNGSTGAQLAGFPSVWDNFLQDQTVNLHWTAMTNAQRAASSLNTRKLVWTGAAVTAAAPGVLTLGVPLLKVSGPAAGAATGSYPIGVASFGAPLSSLGVSADIMPVSGTGDACNPFSALDALAVNHNIALVNRGTCTFAVKAKNAQNAGAVGMIVVDNVAGSPPPDLGGADPTVTIPSVRVTLADGTTIRASLTKRSRTKSGVTANLTLDGSQLAGADAFGFVQMYTPNPFQSGSSVSHYDTGAFRNLLMEPAINGDLTHEVAPPFDLTFPLLQDIGW
jgi:PA domain